jgi:hypothetical protein
VVCGDCIILSSPVCDVFGPDIIAPPPPPKGWFLAGVRL